MKEKRNFPIFNSHLDLAHFYWGKIAQKGCWAIDATCGNGQDTLVLAKNFNSGVIAIDIQEKAIKRTKILVQDFPQVLFFCQNHASFPSPALERPISLIVYNLGYLPGGNKEKTTLVASTLESLKKAMQILLPGGLISVTCYPGHPEGFLEEKSLIEFTQTLDPTLWSVCHHTWNNRKKAPSLFLIQKNTYVF